MAIQNRSALYAQFENNDIPTESSFQNLIDSAANLADTSLQSFGGPIQATSIGASTVSATNFEVLNFSTTNLAATIVSASTGVNFGNNPSASSSTLDYYDEGTWTPVFTGLTSSGAVTITANYQRIGRLVYFMITVQAAVSIATTAGTTRFTLPFPVAFFSTCGTGDASLANTTYGNGLINVSDGQCYPPTISATNKNIAISGTYMTT